MSGEKCVAAGIDRSFQSVQTILRDHFRAFGPMMTIDPVVAAGFVFASSGVRQGVAFHIFSSEEAYRDEERCSGYFTIRSG